MEFKHYSVMLNECIDNLNIKQNGIYIDCTLGGAGHSNEIAKKLNNTGILIGIDQDVEAIQFAKKRLNNFNNIQYIQNNFKNFNNILRELDINKVDGVLIDLGVSSYQLDNGERGFSYNYDSQLDMRMNQNSDLSAKDVVNTYSMENLIKILFEYGEEKYAKSIAKKICEYREKQPINTTFELVNIIKSGIGKYDDKHPAKRSFQAIRIEVNGELEILDSTIRNIVDKLNVGGRLCVMTFHSLEDRIIKNVFNDLLGKCICPKELPVCVCNRKPQIKILTKKPILPSIKELEENSRSKSAKLRVVEKI